MRLLFPLDQSRKNLDYNYNYKKKFSKENLPK